jgi:hypothetical protein
MQLGQESCEGWCRYGGIATGEKSYREVQLLTWDVDTGDRTFMLVPPSGWIWKPY